MAGLNSSRGPEAKKILMEKLSRLIRDENKKEPLTDEECAQILFVNRSEINQLRKSLGIADSRERKRPLLIKEIEKILTKNPGISDRNLTVELNGHGLSVSRDSVSRMLKNYRGELEPRRPSQHDFTSSCQDIIVVEHEDPFSSMIGWDKSLRQKVELAKAAIYYPPNGLHTLIIGATGVGKSELAECMYRFALMVKNVDIQQYPFIVFNCADYAENPQLLMAQLFGYQRGAFTGAETDKDGLVAKANGGILLLDEVHRMPPDGQEMLFQLIDKGKYRKLGETGANHEARIMIIAATTENIEKNLLATFRRRIPIMIELPPLSQRPLKERFAIIKKVFYQETERINKKILVTSNAIRTLLIYNCIGNIGQLRSDIQVACAKGFLNYVTRGNEDDLITIKTSDLPVHIAKDLSNINWNRDEAEKYVSNDLIFMPHGREPEECKEDLYTFPNDIYKHIEDEYQKLQKQGISDEVINRIIIDDLETKVKKIVRQIEKNKYQLITQDLKTVVQPEVIELVQKMIMIAGAGLNEMQDILFYCLATHFNAAVERIRSGQHIANPHLNDVKEHYPKEYRTAREMASIANYFLGFALPEDEIGIIAMYLRTLSDASIYSRDTIGIVVVSHGSVANGMASVANRFLGVDMVRSVEMSLDEKAEEAFERALEAVISVDRGKGILLMVDMGSLAAFGNQITLKLGVRTRTITRVDTLMVIDAIRKVLLPVADLDVIANQLIRDKGLVALPLEDAFFNTFTRYAVISMCFTGEGMAKYIEKIVRNVTREISPEIEIITLGVLNAKSFTEQIDEIRESMNILSIIGTVDPGYPFIPFVSAAEVLKDDGLQKFKLMMRLRYEDICCNIPRNNSNLFSKNLIFVSKDVKNQTEALNILAEALVHEGRVTPNFILGVLEREKMASTAINDSMAIPHSCNGREIIEPAIGVMVLKTPMIWSEGQPASLIFLLALNEKSKHEFQRIYKIINNQEITKMIRMADDADTVFHLLENT